MRVKFLLPAILYCAGAYAGPDDPLQVIELESRFAEDVVELIQPLLGPDDPIVAAGTRLIIRTDPHTLAEIRRVLRSIDVEQRNLLVTVRHRGNIGTKSASVSADGSIEIDDRHKVVIGPSTGEQGITVRGRAAQARGTENNVYQVRTLDGEPGYIDAGQLLLIPGAASVPTTRGGTIIRPAETLEARRGFYVIARTHGESVTLDIIPSVARLSATPYPGVDVNEVSTTVSGRLGEWIALGGYDANQTQRAAGTVFFGQAHGAGQSGFEVRVQVAP